MSVKEKTKKPQAKFQSDLKQVQDHYLDYPYPYRDPEEDKKRILRTQGDFLAEINHFLYKGKKDFNGFRVLVAGGGTGDSAVWLAKQLMEYKDTEVVYLDFSRASMEIAQKRAEYQGITNITWVEDSILDIPKLKLGKFDFINCTGVLHHLADPNLGIKNLAGVLKPDGGASIMVYAKYGRTGVYQIQTLMNMVNADAENRQEEVKNGWEIINHLPATNWYVRGQELLADHKLFGDIGMYDMFLHKQDRAYTIPELYDYVENAGLNIISYVDPYARACLNIESYLPDNELRKKIKSMDKKVVEGICEIMSGTIIKHSVHISKKTDTIADLYDLDNILFTHNHPQLCSDIIKMINTRRGEVMNKMVNYNITDSLNRQMNMNIVVLPSTEYFFKHLEKGELTLREIFDAIRKDMNSDISNDKLLNEVKTNIKSYFTIGALLARHKSVPPFNDFSNF